MAGLSQKRTHTFALVWVGPPVHVDQFEDVLPGQLMVIKEFTSVPGDHGGLSIFAERCPSVLHHAVDIVLDVVMDNALLGELVLLVRNNVVPINNNIVVSVSS